MPSPSAAKSLHTLNLLCEGPLHRLAQAETWVTLRGPLPLQLSLEGALSLSHLCDIWPGDRGFSLLLIATFKPPLLPQIHSFEFLVIRYTTDYPSRPLALYLKDFSSWLIVTFSNSTPVIILSNFSIHLGQL